MDFFSSENESVDCPCLNFTALSKIVNILDSETEVKRLLRWIEGEIDSIALSQNRVLSCGKRSRCRFRYGTSFAILNAIRDSVRPYLETTASSSNNEATSTTTADKQTTNSNSRPLASQTKETGVSYETSFPSLTSKTKETGPPKAHPAASNFLQIPPKLQATTPAATSPTVNILVGKKKAKRRIRPQLTTTPIGSVNSVWSQQSSGGLKNEDSSNVVTAHNQFSNSSNNNNGKFDSSPHGIDSSVVTISPQPSPSKAKLQDETWSKRTEASEEHLRRLADVYVALARNLLIPSIALELQLLLRMATLDLDIQSTGMISEDAFFSSIFSGRRRCKRFAQRVLSKMSNTLRNLPLSLLDNLTCCQPFVEACPDICVELKEEIQYRHNYGLVIDATPESVTGPHAMLSIPFDEDRDSRHNYRTRAEQTMYKNREETRDAFLYQLRSFMSTKGRMLKPEELERTQEQLKDESKKIIWNVLSGNMGWFSHFFCDLLLQIGLSLVEETDQELLNIADRERLQRLHKRICSRDTHVNRSSKKLVLSKNKESISLSPFSEAIAHFPGYQEFFFIFLYAGNNYNFGVNLKACLVVRMLGLLKNHSPNQFERRLTELRLLSRFLGFLIFSPNWRTSDIDSSKFRPVGLQNGINQLENIGLPVDKMVQDAWNKGYAVTVIPWVTDLLKMAKWDSQTQTSKPYRQLLANLRQIQSVTLSKGVSSSKRFGPTMQVLYFFLESLFNNTPSLPSSLPLDSIWKVEQLEPDSIDFEYIGFSTVTLFSSNPQVEDLFNLVNGINRLQVGKSNTRSRKLRPSIVSCGPIAEAPVSSLNTSEDEVRFDNKPFIGDWKLEQDATFVSGNSGISKVKAKLSEAFFHQHRGVKEVCEFAVDNVLKLMTGTFLRDCIMATLFTHKSTASNGEQDIGIVRQMVLQASSSSLRKRLEEKVQKSLYILAPPDTHEKVLAIAVKLAVEKGMQTGEALLGALVSNEMPFLISSIEGNGKENRTTPSIVNEEAVVSCNVSIHYLVPMFEEIARQLSTPIQERDVDILSQSLISGNHILDESSLECEGRIPPESDLRTLFGFVLELERLWASFIEWAYSLEEPKKRSIMIPFLQIVSRLCEVSSFLPRRKLTTSAERCTLLLNLPTELSDGGDGQLLYEILNKKNFVERRSDFSLIVEISRIIAKRTATSYIEASRKTSS